MDIILVEHFDHNAVEVIAYEPKFDQEAPRIYINNDVLVSKLHADTIEEKVAAEKEIVARRHMTPNAELITAEIVKSMKIDYIMTRLIVVEFDIEKSAVKMALQDTIRNFEDNESSAQLLIIEKPAGLVRHKSPHYKPLLEGVVDAVIAALAEEHMKVELLTHHAIAQHDNIEEQLSVRSRWRMPIVFMKKVRGRRLSVEDAKVWAVVAKRLIRGEKDVDPITAVGEALHKSCPAIEASISRPTSSSIHKVNSLDAKNKRQESGTFRMPKQLSSSATLPTSPVLSPAQSATGSALLANDISESNEVVVMNKTVMDTIVEHLSSKLNGLRSSFSLQPVATEESAAVINSRSPTPRPRLRKELHAPKHAPVALATDKKGVVPFCGGGNAKVSVVSPLSTPESSRRVPTVRKSDSKEISISSRRSSDSSVHMITTRKNSRETGTPVVVTPVTTTPVAAAHVAVEGLPPRRHSAPHSPVALAGGDKKKPGNNNHDDGGAVMEMEPPKSAPATPSTTAYTLKPTASGLSSMFSRFVSSAIGNSAKNNKVYVEEQ